MHHSTESRDFDRVSRADILTSQLCAEIDELEAAVKYWKGQSEYWQQQHAQLVESQIKHSHKMMGGMLLLALESPQRFSKK